ncbi:MAG: hypothetical protein Q4G51_01390 [Dermatophilus congolensis]|nr:hypothetical protein [Dermatophilus congolensis]
MYVVDVRLPPQPVVPVVAKAEPGTSSTTTTKTPLERLYDRRAPRRGGASHELLTEADRELIRAVTGENLWGASEFDLKEVSGFATQILLDRRSGPLPPSSEVTVAYLERRGRALAPLGLLNPFSGDALQRAVRYLVSKEAGGIDIAM